MTKLPSLSAIGSCLLLILCMTACSSAGVRASLDRIESYISDNPGKAIEDLDSLGGKNIYGKKNRAHYALLYSMALDKSQIHTTDTSIIASAASYYEDTDDALHKAMSYYYLSKVYMNADDFDNAVPSITKAALYSESLEFPYLNGRIAYFTGLIYEKYEEYEEAVREYEEAVSHFLEAHNDRTAADAYCALSRVCMKMGDIGKSSGYAAEELRAAERIRDTSLIIHAYQDMAMIRTKEGDYKGAIGYLQKASGKYCGGEIPPSFYPVLSRIHLSSGNTGRSRMYAEAMLDDPDAARSPDTYGLLYKIERSAGDYRKSNDYLVRYHHLRDSLENIIYDRSIYYAERKYRNEELRSIISHKDSQLKNRTVMFAGITVILALSVMLVSLQKKKQMFEKEIELQEYHDTLDTVRKYSESLESMKKTQSVKNDLIAHQLSVLNTFMDILLKADTKIPPALSIRFHDREEGKHGRSEEMLEIFTSFFDLKYPGMRDYMESQYPDLAQQDLHLYVLICIDCPMTVIAYILGMSPSYIYNRRAALRKRLGIVGNQTFKSHLDTLRPSVPLQASAQCH